MIYRKLPYQINCSSTQHSPAESTRNKKPRIIFLYTLLYFFLIALISLDASARELKVGIYENQPKVFTEPDGTPAGIFVDILKEIAHREDWTLKYVHGSFAQCLQRLESGEIDLMMDIAYSSEREEKFDFCEDDVVSNWAQVYTRQGYHVNVITDLAGTRLATMQGDIHYERLENLSNGFGFTYNLIPVDDYESVFRLLEKGEADVGVVNRFYGYTHEDQFQIIRSPVIFSPASLRFAVKKGTNQDVIAAINQQVASMKAKKGSVYHQSIRKWLGETSEFTLPKWIAWVLGILAVSLALFFLMSILLKHQVNRKTKHLRKANAELEKQVSETMKAHLELKRSEEQIIRQERLSALGQLSGGIAHDFNNMLIPILGYSDLILEEPGLLNKPDQVFPMLEAIRTAACASRETVKRLQEFYRADPRIKMEQVNLAELVSEVVTATRPLWKAQRETQSAAIQIIEDIPEDLVVTVSRVQIGEALMNLLLNALHAIPANGEVRIRAIQEDGNFLLEVSDTGIGMPESVIRQCLEPFYSTKGEKGTGMGLAMVHGIVKRHNGSLTIDSAQGEGTTFTLEIPLDQKHLGCQSVSNIPLQPVGKLKVLVVDDDENSRKLISEYLNYDGHSVTTANETKSGMEEFDRNEYDLVITDRAMPILSGDRLADHVKESQRPVPVLMITGFAEIMSFQGDHPPGVSLVMGKPFTVRELRNAISHVIFHEDFN